MVEMVAPQPMDVICDPAVAPQVSWSLRASTSVRTTHLCYTTRNSENTFTSSSSTGFDFDNTMLRIGSMNMLLHGVENPDIRYRDSLAQEHADEEEQ